MDNKEASPQTNSTASSFQAICFGMSDAMVLSYALATGLHWAGAQQTTALVVPGGVVLLGAMAMGRSSYATQKEQLEEVYSEERSVEDSISSIEAYWPESTVERGTALDLSRKERAEWNNSQYNSSAHMQSPVAYGFWVGLGYLVAGGCCLMPFIFSYYERLSVPVASYLSLGILLLLGCLRTLSLKRQALAFLRYPVLGLFAAACVYFVTRIFLSA